MNKDCPTNGRTILDEKYYFVLISILYDSHGVKIAEDVRNTRTN